MHSSGLIEILEPFRDYIDNLQPGLKIENFHNRMVCEGVFLVTGPNGPVDEFLIEMEVLNTYPLVQPIIWEVGGRIPKTADRHVFESHGHCCICVWEAYLFASASTSLVDYFTGPVNEYFLSQSVFEVTGQWPFGEYAHDLDGAVEAFAEILGVQPKLPIVEAYLQRLSGNPVKGYHRCPCGCGRVLRRCPNTRLALKALQRRAPPVLFELMQQRLEQQKR